MSIVRAIQRAYQVTKERNWERVYWCIDLHGTVLESNYSNSGFKFINDQVISALQQIVSYPETRIILWSSIHYDDLRQVLDLFVANNIHVCYTNENPEVSNTGTGNFDDKFYFSILVDDKAGFDYNEWPLVASTVAEVRQNVFN